MMKTHYRRISKTALATFIASLANNGNKPDEYTALGTVGAVKVGVEATGWIIIEVVGLDSDDLPGKLVSKSFGGLKDEARAAVHRCRIRKTVQDEEGQDVEVEDVVPENEVPEECAALSEDGIAAETGDAVLEKGINPHRFI